MSRTPALSLVLGVSVACVVCTPRVRAQWTVTNLDPQPGSQSDSQALGVSGTQQVGIASSTAAIWSGTAGSWQLIQGPNFSAAQFNATSGTQQVGWTYMPTSSNHRAGLWSGTTSSFIDLNPPGAFESEALAISGTQQVGWAFVNGRTRAVLWNGTATSWIDLHPVTGIDSNALGIGGGQQVGWARIINTNGNVLACLWSGSAGSYVNLNPSGSNTSKAYATTGLQQVGFASTFDFGYSACVWSGTPGSWVDIGHLAVGSDLSEALATDGTHQVGLARINGEERAWLWNFPTENVTDLHALLPEEFVFSNATGVWSDATTTYVSGWGYNSITERSEAILWTNSSSGCTSPTITTQPVPAQVCDGGTAAFSIGATGTAPLAYQWQWRPPGEEFFVVMVNGTNIHPFTQQPIFETPSIGGTTVTVTPVAGALGAGMGVRCSVSNACGSDISTLVELTPGSCCDSIDFNNDTLFPDTLDIDDFLSVFSGGTCSNDPSCGDVDFNNDGLFPDTLDIDALLSVFSGGACLV